MNVEEFLSEYADHELRRGLTAYTVKRRVRDVERFIEAAGKGVADISGEDVGAYCDGLCSGRAYNDALRALKQFYGFLVREEKLLTDPCRGIEYRSWRADGGGRIFTEEEIHRLLAGPRGETLLELRDRAIMTLLYATALRLGELAALGVGDVDLRRGELLVRRGKGGRERRVPMGEAAALVLERYLEERLRLKVRDREAVFLNRYGDPFKAAGIEKMLARRKVRSGISSPGLAHAFRRSCATHMLASGAPLGVVRRMLGHARIETTARYTHVMKETLSKIHAAAHPKAKEAE